jgi:hypothetical protein
MVTSSKQEIDVGDITLILMGQKTTSFQKRKKKNGAKGNDDEADRSFSVITHHGTLDFIALKAADAKLWIRTLTLLQSASGDMDGDNSIDKFERYIEEQWKRADTDRDETVNLEECVTLMRKMNCELPRKTVKEKMKGKPSMDFKEYHDLMTEFMTKRPEVVLLVKEIKQKFNSKSAKGQRSDTEELTIPELLHFLNVMQRTSPKEPEVTSQQVSAMYLQGMKNTNPTSISTIQFSKILDHSMNSVVDPVATSQGCGDQVIYF